MITEKDLALLEKAIKEADPYHNSLSIRYNGIEVMHAFTKASRPDKPEDFIHLLEELLVILKAPDVPDPEVLGKYSPQPQ